VITGVVVIAGLLAACASGIVTPAPPPEPVASLPFQLPPQAELKASPKKVFAHYLPTFPISLDNKEPQLDYYDTDYLNPMGEDGRHAAYGGLLRDRPLPQSPLSAAAWQLDNMKTEVRRATEAGLDGFTVDVPSLEGDAWDRVNLLFNAAPSVDPDFALVLMPDTSGEDINVNALADAMTILAKSPAAFRLADGRVVISPFYPERLGPAYWRTFLALMSDHGVDVAFVPCFLDYPTNADVFSDISYGFSSWGNRSPAANQDIASSIHDSHARGKIWMQPVAVQDERPNQGVYDEANNSENLRVSWRAAIDTDADWVQLATWNDYSENTQVSPSAHLGWAPLDISSYYLTRFKTGAWPAIVRDVVYVSYRIQPAAARATEGQTTLMHLRPGSSPARDKLEVLSFLTSPATIEADVGGAAHSYPAPAGVNAQLFDLNAGSHSVLATRNGQTMVSVASQVPTTLTSTVQNLEYFYISSGRTGPSAPRQTQPDPKPGAAWPVRTGQVTEVAPSVVGVGPRRHARERLRQDGLGWARPGVVATLGLRVAADARCDGTSTQRSGQ